MLKRIVAVILLVAMLGCLLAACEEKDKSITGLQAKQMVLTDLGLTEDQASVHVHNGTASGEPCYLVYVTYGDQTLEYVIRIADGQILSKGAGSHSH